MYPELITKFGDDVEDLLGLKGGGPRSPKGGPFVQFITAVLADGSIGYDNDGRFNFRRRSLKVMQYLINQMVKSILMNSKTDPRGYEDTRFEDMMFHDLQRAEVWTTFLDRLTGNESKSPKRMIDFKVR